MRKSRFTITAIVLTMGALGIAAQQKPAPSTAPTVVTVYKTPT